MADEDRKRTNEQAQVADYHDEILRSMSKAVGLGFGHSTQYDSLKPGAIADMYMKFCDLEMAKLQTTEMQEKLSWLEYELSKNV